MFSVIDRSLVLLSSFLRVYNFVTLSDYLLRFFRIVSGCSSDEADFNKLFIHACEPCDGEHKGRFYEDIVS